MRQEQNPTYRAMKLSAATAPARVSPSLITALRIDAPPVLRDSATTENLASQALPMVAKGHGVWPAQGPGLCSG